MFKLCGGSQTKSRQLEKRGFDPRLINKKEEIHNWVKRVLGTVKRTLYLNAHIVIRM